MAERVDLKIMHCPTCGEPLKVEKTGEPIVCVACCNTIVPVAEKNAAGDRDTFSGSIRVEGIKTSASALAYLEDFFEDYDWDSFAYAQTLSVSAIDSLVSGLRSASADDKNTWIASFRASGVPYLQKINGCEQVLASAVEAFERDDADAYSKFDAYKRIAAMILTSRGSMVEKLEKYLQKAVKYGAGDSELSVLRRMLESIRTYSGPVEYRELEQVPQVQCIRQERNREIAAQLAAVGIHAEEALARARQLLQNGYPVNALNILLRLKGYSDADKLIEKVDKYFLLSDALEVCGKLYYYVDKGKKDGSFSLYPVENGKVGAEPLIRDMGRIISNHANILFFLDKNCMLRKYDFATGKLEKFPKIRFNPKYISFHPEKHAVFLVHAQQEDYEYSRKSVYQLDLPTGSIHEILKNVQDIGMISGKYMVYIDGADNTSAVKKETRILDLDTLAAVASLGSGKLEIEDFIEDSVVFTVEAPKKTNKDLYIKRLNSQELPILLERNVLRFCKVMAGKLFFYIGGQYQECLISMNPDGSCRHELPMYISNIHAEENGWIYFTRRVGYNSVFCKCTVDGAQHKIIARNVDSFVDRKNGYLYYLDDASSLIKVRMDGTNKQELCSHVETVLSVKEEQIVFVSMDERTVQEFTGAVHSVRSIYSIEFSGEGKRKLAYDIDEAKAYDENTVYYTAWNRSGTRKKMLYSLDIQTYASRQLLEVIPPEKEGCYVATAVYGSYDCPQVWTLRRFRDHTLAASWYGRAFIRVYYGISPTLVKWFGHTGWFKRFWRGKLDRMVYRLQTKGVADTPYEDKNW